MFKIGQKVVCINAKGSQNLVENEIYTVVKCWDDGMGGSLLLKEVEPNFGHYAFFPHRFRAIDDTWVDELLCKLIEEAELKAKEILENNEEQRLFLETHQKDANYKYAENGYKFLGWQNGWKHCYFDENGIVTDDQSKRKTFGYLTADYPEYGKCRDEKHRRIEVRHNNRGSENTVSCPSCMIYWKYDCSD